jgi:hypothetical protein
MRRIMGICLVFYLCLSLSNQDIACGYGYAKEEDPLIKVFKAIILYGRQSDWPKVATEVNSISDRIRDVYRIFKIDLKPQIDRAIQQQDFQTLARTMANLIFLAIREKFYYNRREALEIFIRSKVRLRIAEEYYTILLAGNVRDYDARHNTSLHESIHNRFVKARDTLGSAGFFGAGSVKPNVKEFDALTREIEALLLKAFPYFEAGEAYPE